MKDEKRALYQLILTQLVKDGYFAAASALSEATLVVPPSSVPSDEEERLLKLVQMGLQREREVKRGTAAAAPAAPLEIEMETNEEQIFQTLLSDVEYKGRMLDFELESQLGQVPKRVFPNYTTKFITTHKGPCRVAKFNADGRLVATGSEDTSIKILDADKMRHYNQVKSEHGEDFAPARPVTRTLYDHTAAVNDLDFHPSSQVLVSSSKDCTIKLFDYTQPSQKRSFRCIQDSHNVRSINLHPSGDFLLAGTDMPIVKLYDINTLQCFITSKPQDNHVAAINQVRYGPQGNIYASASKDGSIKLWDTVSNIVINTIPKAHGGSEVSSVQFSKNQKYLLSGGKDGTVKIWELSTGRQVQHIIASSPLKNRLQVTFNFTEDFIITSDETTYSAVVWDTRSGEVVQRLSGHTNVIPWIASSPTEPCLMTCSTDFRARFWVEDV